MMAKPIRALELHYPMIQFLIMNFLLGFQSAYKWGMKGGGYLGGLITGLKKAFKNKSYMAVLINTLFFKFLNILNNQIHLNSI